MPFISFEGLDKAGKTTQIARLRDALVRIGHTCLLTREPGGCPVSEQIRTILLHPDNEMDPMCEALLYAAARSELLRSVIRPALTRGEIVLCDRYVDSSLAYQGMGRELGVDTIRAINDAATGGLWPDLTFYLRIPPAAMQARMTGARDRLEREQDAFYARVYEGYEWAAQSAGDRFCVLDATEPIETLHGRIWDAVVARGIA